MTDLPDHEYTQNIVNMMGSTYLAREKFDDLLFKFAGIRDGQKDSSMGYLNADHFKACPALGACSYYVGIAHLVNGDFEGSKPYLEAIVGVSVSGLPMDQSFDEGSPSIPENPEPEPEPEPPAPE